MTINVKGLEFTACHGALAEEKTSPQPFVVDISLETDNCADDNLINTVNYAEVCSAVKSVVEGESRNLIETLARDCAFSVLDGFEKVKSVTVTVRKPKAPIPMAFSDVSVTFTAERNTVYLSLGSSEGDKKAALDTALSRLIAVRGVKINKVSRYIETEPYGGVAQNSFLNCAAEAEVYLTAHELLGEIHSIEAAGGRARGVRWADRSIDIDIIFFGSEIISRDGLIVPHPDYRARAFVLEPLKEIAPDFVCPIFRKRIGDM